MTIDIISQSKKQWPVASDKIQVNLHLSNLRNIQAQSVKASYAQSVRSLHSSLTEPFPHWQDLSHEKTETG